MNQTPAPSLELAENLNTLSKSTSEKISTPLTKPCVVAIPSHSDISTHQPHSDAHVWRQSYRLQRGCDGQVTFVHSSF